MKLAALSLSLISIAALAAGEASSFASRERRARQIEKQPQTQKYLSDGMYPNIGQAMANAMKACLADGNASTDKFTLVADVTPAGYFSEVSVRPSTDTSRCFAMAFSEFRAAPPPTCDCGPLPIVIDMTINP